MSDFYLERTGGPPDMNGTAPYHLRRRSRPGIVGGATLMLRYDDFLELQNVLGLKLKFISQLDGGEPDA